MFLNSLNPVLEEEVRRTRLREELNAQRGGSALPDLTIQQAQAMARAVAAALPSLHPKIRERGNMPVDRCSFCSRHGHEERDCRRKKEQKSEKDKPTPQAGIDRQRGYNGSHAFHGGPRGDAKSNTRVTDDSNSGPRADRRDIEKKQEFNGTCKEFGVASPSRPRKETSPSLSPKAAKASNKIFDRFN
jgi:hypothetical protein